jgi:intracellular sulfur oxidation DsrE/DsrF family protein
MAGVTRAGVVRSLFLGPVMGLFAFNRARAETAKPHRMVLHVDQNDADVMNLTLNNAHNLLDYYRAKNEDIDVEVVAYGPGLHMLRDDTSPVKARIKELAEVSFPSNIVFSACNNTKQAMEKREGHPIPIIPQATIVPAGVVRIMELQEQGYAYAKP